MKNTETAIEDFIFHCRYEKGLSSKTIISYQTDLKQFNLFINKPVNKPGCFHDIERIDKTILKKYIENIFGYKPRTVKRKIATLKAMFNYMEFEDELKINPFRKMRIKIKVPKEIPVTLSNSEVRKIFKTIYYAKNKCENGNSYSYREIVRNIAIVELLFATGIRVSELCELKYKNADLLSGSIRVIGKGDKERIIEICHKETIQALNEYYSLFKDKIIKSGSFFINRLDNTLSSQSVRYMIRKYSQKARIKKHVTPHTFRHTFATLLLEENVDIRYIQHFLGHSSIMTTQIYTQVNKRKQRYILANKHPRKRFEVNDFV